jgi:hypothetical protein
VAAMTKAASYMLWNNAFTTMREWLVAHAVFMISDSTGVTQRNWKKKEKQLDLIIQNSLYISGSIEGISGMENINMQLSGDAQDQLPDEQDGAQ